MADLVSEAQALYQEALEALRDQRRQIKEDLAFSDPSNPQQWEDEEQNRRLRDPGGARPCLVFDQLGQYVANVAGQFEQRPPGMHSVPVDGGGDRRVSEQLDGWFRHIEHQSRAVQHYARAGTSQARTGVGYLLLRPEYTDRALGYQEPRISSEGDPLRIVFDPWSQELDGSDATFAYHSTPVSLREFKRRWPKADPVGFGEDEQVRDDRESVNVVEAWEMKDVVSNKIVFLDMAGDQVCLPEEQFWQAQQAGQVQQYLEAYKEKRRAVYWRRMNGAEVLDTVQGPDGKEAEFPASHIGIVPMYGYVGFSDGRMTYCGIPRRARQAQQAYNFHKSEERAYILLAPKSPWIGPAAAFAPYKNLWDKANIEQRAYLPFEHLDESGNPIPAPQRMPVSVNLQNHIQGSQEALRDIQASLGMYQANLGAPSNETSGVAIESRKQQGEASTSHFQSHAAAAIAHVGRMILQMVPRLVDTRRQLRTLGIDGLPGSVMVDPQAQGAVQETSQGLTINPNIGKYDVRVVVGSAFNTQRTKAAEALNEIMARNPAMATIIAPFWAQMQDFPNSDKLAQALAVVTPEPVRQILQPNDDGAPKTSELMAQIDQLKQALQEATQIAHQATQEAEEMRAEVESQDEAAEAKIAELSIKKYEAETKRLQVTGANEAQIQAIVQQMVQQMLTAPQPDLSGKDEAQAMQPESYEMQPLPAGDGLEIQ
jgi:hypothetical protein